MTYNLEFDRRALKEWNKLGDTVRHQFKKKLRGIGESSNRSQSTSRAPGLLQSEAEKRWLSRLIYQVLDQEIVVFVIAIGKREREAAYEVAQDRFSLLP